MIVIAIVFGILAAGLGLVASAIWNGGVRGARYPSLRARARRELWLGIALLAVCIIPLAVAIAMNEFGGAPPPAPYPISPR